MSFLDFDDDDDLELWEEALAVGALSDYFSTKAVSKVTLNTLQEVARIADERAEIIQALEIENDELNGTVEAQAAEIKELKRQAAELRSTIVERNAAITRLRQELGE